ncbi:tetratricopeptide repeat protein [Leptothoe sp. EHU-05/26/07-4]
MGLSIYEQIEATIATRRSCLHAYQLAEYKAVRNWLRRYRPVDESNLAQVTGYLEAFYHLSQVEDWENARSLAFMRSQVSNHQELHKQLFVWGYYRQQQRVYRTLFHQIDSAVDLACLSGLGNLEDVWGNFDRAIEYHYQALTLARVLGSEEARVAALGSLGNAYLSLKNFERAIDCYQQQFDLAEMSGQPRLVGVALGGLSNAYRSIEAYELALDAAQRRVEVARSSSDRQGEGDGYCSMGSTYLVQGELAQALTVLSQAVTIAQSIGHRLGECRALGNLGLVYQALTKDDKAIACLEQTLVLASEIEDREGRQMAILQLEGLQRRRQDTEQAMRYQLLAREFVSEPLDRAVLLLNLGASCRSLGRLEAAIDHYQELLTVVELLDEAEDEQRLLRMMVLYCFALVYQEQGEIKQAWHFCQSALDLSNEAMRPLVEKCLDLQKVLAMALQKMV